MRVTQRVGRRTSVSVGPVGCLIMAVIVLGAIGWLLQALGHL